MKFNLKNRPDLRRAASRGDKMWVYAYEEWFEGFEKELREYIAFVDGLRSHGKPKEVTIKYKIYKEILGQ